MAENHKRYLDIGEQYYVSADGTLYFVEPIIKDKEVIGQSETALANHAPILKEQRVPEIPEPPPTMRTSSGVFGRNTQSSMALYYLRT